MKHLIVAGVPRAGKSTLSRRIARGLGWQHVSMDAVIAGFERCFPETGIDTGLSVNKDKPSLEILGIISAKIAPFLRAMTDPEEYDRANGPMVIDMYQLLPRDYMRFQLSDTCRVLYLVTGSLSPEERSAIQKQWDTPEDYTYGLSDDERLEACRELVAQSRFIREQCASLGLPCHETARDRERVFEAILRQLDSERRAYE